MKKFFSQWKAVLSECAICANFERELKGLMWHMNDLNVKLDGDFFDLLAKFSLMF